MPDYDLSTLDSLLDTPINPEDVQEALKSDLVPEGWAIVGSFKAEPRAVNNGPNKGRLYIHFDATLASDGAGNPEAYKNRRAFFNASPDMRPGKNGRPDFMSRLWAGLVTAAGNQPTPRATMEKLLESNFMLRVAHRKRQDNGETEATVVATKGIA